MCLNMRRMKNPCLFVPKICWMFLNIPLLDAIFQKPNYVKLQCWEEVLVRMILVTKDNKYGTY